MTSRLAASALAVLLGLGAGPLAPAVTAQALVSRELRAEAARLFRELADLRGVAAPGPAPPLTIRTREERRRFVERELAN